MNSLTLGLLLGIIMGVSMFLFCLLHEQGLMLIQIVILLVLSILLFFGMDLTKGFVSGVALVILFCLIIPIVQKILRVVKIYHKCKGCEIKRTCIKKEKEICIKKLKAGDKIKFTISHSNGKYHIETISGTSKDFHKIDFESGNNSVDGSCIEEIYKLN